MNLSVLDDGSDHGRDARKWSRVPGRSSEDNGGLASVKATGCPSIPDGMAEVFTPRSSGNCIPATTSHPSRRPESIGAPDHPDADGPIVQVVPTGGREEPWHVVAIRPQGNRPDAEGRFDRGEG